MKGTRTDQESILRMRSVCPTYHERVSPAFVQSPELNTQADSAKLKPSQHHKDYILPAQDNEQPSVFFRTDW